MKDKVIGIFGWKVTETSYGCSAAYLQYLSLFGRVRVLTNDEPIDDRLDLLVLPGGSDINPLRYGEAPNLFTSKSDPIKEYQDTVLLPRYIEAGIPVFGICRGIQAIGVHFGAKLVQDMYHETNDKDRGDTVHSVVIVDEAFAYRSQLNKKRFKVNSLHHQCVSGQNFPECLKVIGAYEGKNSLDYIEIIAHKTLPIYGVQYHPEELVEDPISEYIIKELLTVKEFVHA
jgi:putative glutamine amidotransferase